MAKQKFSRRDQLRFDFLKEYNVTNLSQLRLQAEYLSANDDPRGAIHRYEILIRMGEKDQVDTLEMELILAALEIEAGRPDRAFRMIKRFGREHPDSPLINRAVELAFRLGMGYATSQNENYDVMFRNGKAITCMEFVDEHDPYSLEAAEGLLTLATIRMKSKSFSEALINLQTILRRQPGTEIAAQTEVHIAECYLSLHKGSDYDMKSLRQAIRYLRGYLNHQANGILRDRASELLTLANRRLGRRRLDQARYYFTARKWASAKTVLEGITANEDLKDAHTEAEALLAYAAERL
jgi:outer membrane protein assembly factor BamD (BamD/ComL family)